METKITKQDQRTLFNNKRAISFDNYEKMSDLTLPNYLEALSFNKELSRYGYCLSLEAINEVAMLDKESMKQALEDTIDILDDVTGTSDFQSSEPFYKNFPEEVMNKSEAELYFNAMMYYTYSQTDDPEITKIANNIRDMVIDDVEIEREKLPASDFNELKVVNLGSEYDLNDIIYSKFQALSLSGSSLEELYNFIKDHNDWKNRIFQDEPEINIPSHETRANIALVLYELKDSGIDNVLTNAEDVLRFAVILSKFNAPDRDYLNANLDFNTKKTPIFKLSKADQREIKRLLNNNCHDLYTSIWHRKDLFNKLKEYINAKDPKYPRVVGAFDNLTQGKRLTEHGDPYIRYTPQYIKSLLQDKSPDSLNKLTDYINKNPLDYMKHCHYYITQSRLLPETELNSKKIEALFDGLKTASEKQPIVASMKYAQYLENIKDTEKRPIIINQGQREDLFRENKQYLTDEDRLRMQKQIMEGVRVRVENNPSLNEKYKDKNIYIDPELKNRISPERSIRNSSKGATLLPGSQITGNKDKNMVVFGIYWANKDNERADIDLSVSMFNKDGERVDRIYYCDLKGDLGVGLHSGDYTSGETCEEINGAVEYIYLDKEKLKNAGISKVVSVVNGFNIPFCNAESVRMIVEQKSGSFDDIDSIEHNYRLKFKGEIMDPRELDYSYRLTQNSRYASTFCYDVERDSFIALDSTKQIHYNEVNNIENSTIRQFVDIDIYKAYNIDTPNMEDLFKIATMSGNRVNDIKDADYVFTAEPIDAAKMGCPEAEVINSYELDKISKEFCDGTPTPWTDKELDLTITNDYDIEYDDDIEH